MIYFFTQTFRGGGGGEEEEEEEEEEEGWVLGESESAKHCCHLVACEGISLIN